MLLRKKSTKGFTLIELIIVISIMGILSAIAVPAYGGYVKKAKEEVCNANSVQLERMYEIYLELESIEHTDAVFEKYLQEMAKIYVLSMELLLMWMGWLSVVFMLKKRVKAMMMCRFWIE